MKIEKQAEGLTLQLSHYEYRLLHEVFGATTDEGLEEVGLNPSEIWAAKSIYFLLPFPDSVIQQG